MKKITKNYIKVIICALFAIACGVLCGKTVMADDYGLTMAPMNQEIILSPGEEFNGSFRISNPSSHKDDLYYELSVEPFHLDDKNEKPVYETEGDANEIVKWVSFDVPVEGKISPNEVKEVIFTVNVPENAAAGGQYFAIIVTFHGKGAEDVDTQNDLSGKTGAIISETRRMAHLVYSEVAGKTVKKGEILSVNVPGFLFSDKITGSSSVANQGNVHSKAKYTLRVFPLFSNEEVYTNEENPEEFLIMPGRTFYHESAWEKTPEVGIFNVVYEVDFGENDIAKAEVKKMVIKCPFWLFFLIIFVIIVAIIWIVLRVKNGKKRIAASNEK